MRYLLCYTPLGRARRQGRPAPTPLSPRSSPGPPSPPEKPTLPPAAGQPPPTQVLSSGRQPRTPPHTAAAARPGSHTRPRRQAARAAPSPGSPTGLPWEEGAAAENAAAALLPVTSDAKDKLEDKDDDEASALPSLHGTPAPARC